jgi:hypothetical protein
MYRPVLRASIAMIALVGATMASLSAASAGSGVAGDPANPDSQLVAAMKDVPGFGGAYTGADGALHVWLTKPTTAGGARARAAFAPASSGAATVVHRADYTFAQLKTWHDRLAGLIGKSGVTLTDIDDRTNRVTVGVEDPAATGERVKASLARLGIPPAAVDIVTAAPVTPNVRDRTRPLRGGIQIQYARGTTTVQCTMGVPAIRSGIFGFVANSHCSTVRGQLDNGLYWQASRAAGNNDLVGAEMVDQPFKTGGTCPAGQQCRLTDTNFVRSDVDVAVGRIARPPLNSTNWNGTDTFRITDAWDTEVGNAVQKVGRATGRTQGTVVRTCANRTVRDTNITLLCQDLADYTSDEGDSGSPVFEITNSPATNDVRLVGIHWGSSVIDGVLISTFSPYRFIIPEIGYISVCAIGSC